MRIVLIVIGSVAALVVSVFVAYVYFVSRYFIRRQNNVVDSDDSGQ